MTTKAYSNKFIDYSFLLSLIIFVEPKVCNTCLAMLSNRYGCEKKVLLLH